MGKYNDVKLRILERILKMKKKEMALFVLVWIVLAVAFCLLFSYILSIGGTDERWLMVFLKYVGM